MSDFKYFRNKRTGRIMRALAYPYMGQNSIFEKIDEEEFRAASKPTKAGEQEAVDKALPDNNDLTAGLDDGEDSR